MSPDKLCEFLFLKAKCKTDSLGYVTTLYKVKTCG